MNILHRLKKPEGAIHLEKGAIVTVFLDEGAVRMCLRYGIHPGKLMETALSDAIHLAAITREASYFGERKIIQPESGRDPR